MLKKIKSRKLCMSEGSFAIVASHYNARYVDSMLRAAQAELKQAGVREIKVVRVPGAYEIPIVTAELARCSRNPPFRHHLPRGHPARRDDARGAHRRGGEPGFDGHPGRAWRAGHS